VTFLIIHISLNPRNHPAVKTRVCLALITNMATAAEVEPKIDRDTDTFAEKTTLSDLEHHHAENGGTYQKYEITEEDCYGELGFSYPESKKWLILSIIFLVQVSMNFNTSLYSNAVGGISDEFGVSAQAARVGAAVFLITYAFGCELWAPWSEELGRWPVLQLSLLFVNIWQIPVAIAPNYATIIVFRALGGLSTAGGSVTLAMVADMVRLLYAIIPADFSLTLCSGNPTTSSTPWRSSFSLPSADPCSVPSSAVSSNNFWPGAGPSGFNLSSAVPFRSHTPASFPKPAQLF
jgi:hypothetical protein